MNTTEILLLVIAVLALIGCTALIAFLFSLRSNLHEIYQFMHWVNKMQPQMESIVAQIHENLDEFKKTNVAIQKITTDIQSVTEVTREVIVPPLEQLAVLSKTLTRFGPLLAGVKAGIASFRNRKPHNANEMEGVTNGKE